MKYYANPKYGEGKQKENCKAYTIEHCAVCLSTCPFGESALKKWAEMQDVPAFSGTPEEAGLLKIEAEVGQLYPLLDIQEYPGNDPLPFLGDWEKSKNKLCAQADRGMLYGFSLISL